MPKSSVDSRVFPWSALVLTLTALTAGCTGEAQPQSRAPGSAAAVPVTVAAVVEKDMPVEISVIGTAEAYSSVAIRAQITGELTSVNFQQGDDVRAGQVLFTLDQRPLEAMLHQAEANLARDTAQAANAKASADRYQDLAQRGLATREQLGQTGATAAALEATVAADTAAVENAKVQLQYATIRAPIGGRTGSLMVTAGNLVRANDQTPLVVTNQITPIYVTFGVPEPMLPDLKRYLAQGSLRVEARAPTDDAPPAVGRITFVDNQVDQSTGTIKVKATFPNENRRLWPGQFLNVVVRLTTIPHAVVVPSTAVQTGPQGQYVYVVKGGKTAELQPVTVERTAGDETVVKTGVAAGDSVVTDGQLRLLPGSRISIKGAPKKATS
jgi:multidrug efflux system membrane fusion protein